MHSLFSVLVDFPEIHRREGFEIHEDEWVSSRCPVAANILVNILTSWPEEDFHMHIPALLRTIKMFSGYHWKREVPMFMKALYTSAFTMIAPERVKELPKFAVNSLLYCSLHVKDGHFPETRLRGELILRERLDLMLMISKIFKHGNPTQLICPVLVNKLFAILRFYREQKGDEETPHHLIELLIVLLVVVKNGSGTVNDLNGWLHDPKWMAIGISKKAKEVLQGNLFLSGFEAALSGAIEASLHD